MHTMTATIVDMYQDHDSSFASSERIAVSVCLTLGGAWRVFATPPVAGAGGVDAMFSNRARAANFAAHLWRRYG